MLIDWFTVGAQVVNFLVLVVVLKVVLFDRVVEAMDRRQEAIAARIRAAEDREADASAEADAYRSRRRELDEDAARRLEGVEAEAAARRRQLLGEARADVEELRSRWEEALRRDRAELLDEIRRRTGEQACAVGRRVLADLADAELEARLIRVALRRLEGGADRLKPLAERDGAGSGPVVVRTAFPLAVDQADLVRDAVAAHLGCDRWDVAFARDPELVCGLEIRLGGWSVGWSVDAYLDAVVDELDGLLPVEAGIGDRAGAEVDRPDRQEEAGT